jgi:hypothetical protein
MEKLDSTLQAPSKGMEEEGKKWVKVTTGSREIDGGVREVALELLLVSELSQAAVVGAGGVGGRGVAPGHAAAPWAACTGDVVATGDWRGAGGETLGSDGPLEEEKSIGDRDRGSR